MSSKKCSNPEKYKPLVTAYVFGGMPEEDARSAESHIRGCEECRREAGEARRLYWLGKCALTPEPTKGELEEAAKRVKSAYLGKVRRRKVVRFVSIGSIGAVAAGLIVFVVCHFVLVPDASPEREKVHVSQQKVEKVPEKREKIELAESPKEILKKAQVEFKKLAEEKAAPEAFQSVLDKAKTVLSKGKDPDLKLGASYLVFRSYESMGRYEERKEALRGYVDLCEKVKGADGATRRLEGEGHRYYRSKDHIAAMECYDMALSRYPDSASIPKVKYRIGQVYWATGVMKEGTKQILSLVEEYPDDKWTNKARYALGYVYLNEEKYPEVEKIMGDYQAHTNSREEKAVALCLVGRARYYAGDIGGAAKVLRQVIREYSDTTVVSQAKNLLTKMKRDVLQEIMEG